MNLALLPDLLASSARADVVPEPPDPVSPPVSAKLAIGLGLFALVALVARNSSRRAQGAK